MPFEKIISNNLQGWFKNDLEARFLVRLGIALIIIQFIIFKIAYPLPNLMPPDSYSYIDAARQNLTINIWAIGYSKFLRLVSCLTTSSIFLVWLQYLLLEACLLYFLFSLRYFINPGKWLFRATLLLSILNPLIPHISNFVSSDALFTSLSLVWVTQLFWILAKPTRKLILFHAIILLLAFTVRFSALYYPMISIAVIMLNKMKLSLKWLGATSIIILLGSFTGRTVFEYFKKTHTIQYSAFGGWQLAANALYGYAYTSPDPPDKIPEKFKELQMVVNKHMDSIRFLTLSKRPDKDLDVYYLWNLQSPLIVYTVQKWGKDTTTPYDIKWETMGPLYASYGQYVIIHHPLPYFCHFIWPNIIKFYAPPTGFMGKYVLGYQYVDPTVSRWFRWGDNHVYNRFHDKNIEVIKVFPYLSAVINIVFISGYISILVLGISRNEKTSTQNIIKAITSVWLANMLFSVFAAPIELRYQLLSFLITFPFALGFIDSIIKAVRINRRTPSNINQYQGGELKLENIT